MNANVIGGIGDLRQRRRAAGLSQEALAREAKCSTSMVRLIERGYRPDTRSTVLDRIAAVLRDRSDVSGVGTASR